MRKRVRKQFSRYFLHENLWGKNGIRRTNLCLAGDRASAAKYSGDQP